MCLARASDEGRGKKGKRRGNVRVLARCSPSGMEAVVVNFGWSMIEHVSVAYLCFSSATCVARQACAMRGSWRGACSHDGSFWFSGCVFSTFWITVTVSDMSSSRLILVLRQASSTLRAPLQWQVLQAFLQVLDNCCRFRFSSTIQLTFMLMVFPCALCALIVSYLPPLTRLDKCERLT